MQKRIFVNPKKFWSLLRRVAIFGHSWPTGEGGARSQQPVSHPLGGVGHNLKNGVPRTPSSHLPEAGSATLRRSLPRTFSVEIMADISIQCCVREATGSCGPCWRCRATLVGGDRARCPRWHQKEQKTGGFASQSQICWLGHCCARHTAPQPMGWQKLWGWGLGMTEKFSAVPLFNASVHT